MNFKLLLLLQLFSLLLANSKLSYHTIADSLPNNMPIVKTFLWGKDGALRNTIFDPNSRIKELEIRREMLQLHQKIALFTLGCMIYQYNSGISMKGRSYSDFTEQERQKHMKLGYVTFGSYMSAASLSIFSPPGMKYTKKTKLSSMKIHRYLATIHFTGMMLQPYIGYQASIAGLENRVSDRKDLLKYHDVIGSITTFSYILSFLTTLF